MTNPYRSPGRKKQRELDAQRWSLLVPEPEGNPGIMPKRDHKAEIAALRRMGEPNESDE